MFGHMKCAPPPAHAPTWLPALQVAALCETERGRLEKLKAKAAAAAAKQDHSSPRGGNSPGASHARKKSLVARAMARASNGSRKKKKKKKGDADETLAGLQAQTYWLLATLGEVSVIQGRLDNAMAYFQAATERCGGGWQLRAAAPVTCVTNTLAFPVLSAPKAYGKFASTLRQLKLLLGHRHVHHRSDYSRRSSALERMTAQFDVFKDKVLAEARHHLRVRGMVARTRLAGSCIEHPRVGGVGTKAAVDALGCNIGGSAISTSLDGSGKSNSTAGTARMSDAGDGGATSHPPGSASGRSGGGTSELGPGGVPGGVASRPGATPGPPARPRLGSESMNTLRDKCQIACERVIEALRAKKPLDAQFVTRT